MSKKKSESDEDEYCIGDRLDHKKISKKNYQCDACMKFFSSNQSLREHQSLHTNSRPHTCEICGKYFRYGSQLCIHKRIHFVQVDINCPKLTTLIENQKIDKDRPVILNEKVRLPQISKEQLFHLPSFLEIFRNLN